MIKAILFDLFGTVVAYGDVVEGTRMAWEGIYAVLRELGASVPYERFVPEWERQLVAPLEPCEDVAGTPFLSKMLRLFRSYGLPPDLDAATRAACDCLDVWDQHIHLPEDTIPTLEMLRARYALALVSNFDHPPYVRQLLARHDLVQRFDYIVISGDVRIDKPDPRIYHLALRALGCAPEEALFVGDSLSSDIAGAVAVGCRPVLIDMDGRHTAYVGQRIGALGELLSMLPQDL